MKFLLVLIACCLCCALAAAADEDIDKLNEIEEAATLTYDFEEKIDKVVETFDVMKRNNEFFISAISTIQAEMKELKQAIDTLRSKSLSIETTENWNSNLNVLDVKCPGNRLPESCSEVSECKTDIYHIMLPTYSNDSLAVSCDLTTDNGRWTVIQRRQDGSINFYRNWTDYVEGFGDLNGEFFIGLKKLHYLTSHRKQELYIHLEDFEGEQRYAKYGIFEIGSEDNGYNLTVGDYSGNAGDSLSYHNGKKFSTWDRDNDKFEKNCAERWKSAWWFNSCHESNLNGEYLMGKTFAPLIGRGVKWGGFRGTNYSLKFARMMIRPKNI